MLKIENPVVLRLRRNPLLYYTPKGDSIYPHVFEYGVQSDLQNIRSTGMYDDVTEIPQITAKTVELYKNIRASSLPHYKNSFYGKLTMWNKHPLSPNFEIVDTDATNTGSFIHLLFEYKGNPPDNLYFCEAWATLSRTNSKSYQKLREKVGLGKIIVSPVERNICLDIYAKASKELEERYGNNLGITFENNKMIIPNYLNTGWSLSGHIDLVRIDETTGRHMVVDLKSVDPSQLSDWEGGSYNLGAKFSQLEGYRVLYSFVSGIPMEMIDISLLLIIRNLKKTLLGSCTRVITPKIQHTKLKLESFENIFRDITSFFSDRMENKMFKEELVTYKVPTVKLAPDLFEYNTLFNHIAELCLQEDISFVDGEDYFELDDYKVITYRFLIKILAKLGYGTNVLTVRDGDTLKYNSIEGNLYQRDFECLSSPTDKVLYYCCEINKIGTSGISVFQRYADSEVQETAKKFGSYRNSYFWDNFYNQMANVTVIKHTIRTFMFESDLLNSFLNFEKMTYEGLDING